MHAEGVAEDEGSSRVRMTEGTNAALSLTPLAFVLKAYSAKAVAVFLALEFSFLEVELLQGQGTRKASVWNISNSRLTFENEDD